MQKIYFNIVVFYGIVSVFNGIIKQLGFIVKINEGSQKPQLQNSQNSNYKEIYIKLLTNKALAETGSKCCIINANAFCKATNPHHSAFIRYSDKQIHQEQANQEKVLVRAAFDTSGININEYNDNKDNLDNKNEDNKNFIIDENNLQKDVASLNDWSNLVPGQSVACNGICLTITDVIGTEDAINSAQIQATTRIQDREVDKNMRQCQDLVKEGQEDQRKTLTGGNINKDIGCNIGELEAKGEREENEKIFCVYISPETTRVTNVNLWQEGKTIINLERPMRIGDYLDGHFVLGHVDTKIKCLKILINGKAFGTSGSGSNYSQMTIEKIIEDQSRDQEMNEDVREEKGRAKDVNNGNDQVFTQEQYQVQNENKESNYEIYSKNNSADASVGEVQFCEMFFELPQDFAKYIVPKGSVTLNGIALTVSSVDYPKMQFSVQIIPYTYYHTNLRYLKVSDEPQVNLEIDPLARYTKFHL